MTAAQHLATARQALVGIASVSVQVDAAARPTLIDIDPGWI